MRAQSVVALLSALGLAATIFLASNVRLMGSWSAGETRGSEPYPPSATVAAATPLPGLVSFAESLRRVRPTSTPTAPVKTPAAATRVPVASQQPQPYVENPQVHDPGTAPPADARYLYSQFGFPDGRSGVANPGILYQVYQRPNGEYWLRPA